MLRFLFRWQRRGAGRRGAFAGPNICGSQALVFGRCQFLELGVTTRHRLLMELLEKRNAPAAARAGPAAFGQLARDFGPKETDKIDQLSPRDVKTITDLGVRVHSAHCKREHEKPKGDVPGDKTL